MPLEQLFAENARELARYFARRHGLGEGVEDLVQETFFQLARGLAGGRSLRCARGYLFGIARHVSQAAWSQRERARWREVSLEGEQVEVAAPEADARVEAARETMAGLEGLQREVLELRYGQGLSYAEIAAVLGIPLGTVRSRLHHAVARVRERLQPPAKRGAAKQPQTGGRSRP